MVRSTLLLYTALALIFTILLQFVLSIILRHLTFDIIIDTTHGYELYFVFVVEARIRNMACET